MWASMWPGVARGGATGRLQSPTACMCRRGSPPTWRDLFATYLGADWLERHDDPALWDAVLTIPDDALWKVRQELRRYLFAFVRERARDRWTVERVGTPRIVAAGTLLDPETPDHRLRPTLRRLQAVGADLPRSRTARAHPQRRRDARCRSSSPARRIRPTISASTICSTSTGARSIRCSAAASPSSTTTTCTSRTSSSRAATSG